MQKNTNNIGTKGMIPTTLSQIKTGYETLDEQQNTQLAKRKRLEKLTVPKQRGRR